MQTANRRRRSAVANSCARSAPARRSRRRRGAACDAAQADTETNDEKRKARYKETDHVKTFYRVNRYPRTEGGRHADQENRTRGTPRTLAAALATEIQRRLDRRTFLRRSGLVAGALAALGALPLGSVRKAEAGPPPARRRRGHDPQEHLHALLGRLHRHGRSVERRVDRPGAGLGSPDQPRLALRQGRVGARTRARRPPAEISDEARQRPVDADLLGSGDQRDRRQADGDPREVRAGLGLLARLGQVLQRGRLSQSASSRRSGAPTTPTTRRASAIRPPSPA